MGDVAYKLVDRKRVRLLLPQEWYGLPTAMVGELIGETDELPDGLLRYRVEVGLDPVPEWWHQAYPGASPRVTVLVLPEEVEIQG